ncbi:MAG TPA: MraY family glycosyltransferase [Sunxiuqinia sp.]|nr:MraY family glycosyltransferase [Sunxiuqinia sp.]
MTTQLINIILAIILSFAITYISIPTIVRISREKKLFDEPNHRRLNKKVVPTLGGVGIFIGLILGTSLLLGTARFPEYRYIVGALILLFFIGLKDDILVISAKKKLVVQFAATIILVGLGQLQISNLSNLFLLNHLNVWLSVPLSMITLLLIINAVNLIDGIDGLAAGISFVASGLLGVWFLQVGRLDYAILSFSLAGSLLAFLRFNLWGGGFKIFMGDTGSLILGGVLGVLVIKFMQVNQLTQETYQIKHAPTFVLALLIVPITDTLRVFTIRLSQKRSPFSPDMNHIHHVLIQLGMKHIKASGFLVLYTLFFVSLSIVTQNYLSSTISFLILLSFSFGIVGFLAKRNEKIKQNRAKQIQLTRRILTTGVPIHEDPFNYRSIEQQIYQN